jgi:ubiquinol-cytochrome c reductase cytochrome c subunit
MTAGTPKKRPRRGVLTRLAASRGPRSRGRRAVGTALRMLIALFLVGGVYAGLAPNASAEDTPLSAAAKQGQAIFNQNCITCHGRNAEGVEGRGPSLIGVGSAAVEFQVTTGRMPAAGQGAQIARKQPSLTNDQAVQLGAYIQELGGGPQLPKGDNLSEGGDIAAGGELFRVNCSSCHAFSAGGGALSSGKFAPSLKPATDRQIYAAMLTGPQNMPVFGDNQLTDQQKRDIIAYIQNMKNDQSQGGWGIGRIGPVTEGLVIFLVGITFLVFTTLWIAGKS